MAKNRPPFFILANPRSGSSLLRIICESHQNITVPPESGFLQWLYIKYKDWGIEDNYDLIKRNVFNEDLLLSKKFETYNFNFNLFNKLIDKELPDSYSHLIALVYTAFGLQNKKDLKVWGDKNNYYVHHTELINELYPNAKYIHLVRDGRDVAVSYLNLQKLSSLSKYVPKLTNNIEEVAKEWHLNNSLINSFLDNNVREENILKLYYEDLILDLELNCQRICNFLNVSFDKKMLKYYIINKANNIEPMATIDWKKKTLQAPDKSNIGKYTTMLSKKEIESFNKIAFSSLEYFNYEF